MLAATEYLLPLALLLGAVLYTSVGHAGASAYIAIMTLFGLSAGVIKPTALTLNILVSAFISYRYVKSGYFSRPVALLVVAGAIPAAFLGGYWQLPGAYYKPLVGVVLLLSALRLLVAPRNESYDSATSPSTAVGMGTGAAIGLLSGLTGTGGGIFLSPILVFRRWTTIQQASGTAAVFILANSVFGLLGNISAVRSLPAALPVYGVAVLAGAVIGTRLGLKRFDSRGLRLCLAAVLLVAAGKFLLA
jgi:uncharacterized membrane protein YfcA